MFAEIANGEPPIFWQDPYWRQWEYDRTQDAADEALGIHKYQIKIPQAFCSSVLITNVNSEVLLLQHEAVISSQVIISQDFLTDIYSFLVRQRIRYPSAPYRKTAVLLVEVKVWIEVNHWFHGKVGTETGIRIRD